MFQKWLELVDSVSRRVGLCLRRYGWDVDDAIQEGRLRLLQLSRCARVSSFSEECLRKYLPLSIRRHLFRAACHKKNLLVSVPDALAQAQESRGRSWVEQFVSEYLDGAPRKIRQYVESLFNGQSVTTDALTRRRAAKYLSGVLG